MKKGDFNLNGVELKGDKGVMFDSDKKVRDFSFFLYERIEKKFRLFNQARRESIKLSWERFLG